MSGMNQRLLLCLSLAVNISLIQSAKAQDWKPYLPGVTHTFGYPATSLTPPGIHNLRLDSMSLDGSDTVWHFNRIVRMAAPGDSVFGCWSSTTPLPAPRRYDQDNWNGGAMIQRPGGLYQFSFDNGDTAFLETQAPVASPFLFLPDSGITATLDSITWQPVLTTLDSVRHYTLSNGKVIRLSQHHGLVETYPFLPFYEPWGYVVILYGDTLPHQPALTLRALPELGLGQHLPGFLEVFDFSPGDHFQFYQTYYYSSFATEVTSHTWLDYTVLSRTFSPDSSVFDYQLFHTWLDSTWDFFTGLNVATGASTVNWHFDKANYGILDHLTGEATGDMDTLHLGGAYLPAMLNGREVRNFEQLIYKDTCAKALYADVDIRATQSFGRGLGETHYLYADFTQSWIRDLVCYRKGTEEGGTCLEYNARADQGISSPQFHLWPVPAHDMLTLEAVQAQEFEWQLISTDGKVVRSGQSKGTAELEVTDLPAGIYLLNVPASGWSRVVQVAH